MHIILRQGKGGPGGRHGLKNAVHVLFKRRALARREEGFCRFSRGLELQPQSVAHVIEI